MSKKELRELQEDPHQGVKRYSDYLGDIRTSCDVLVIGSGPGGAVVAKELAEANRDVILLEEGPPYGVSDFRQEAGESLQRMLREGGTRAARGNLFMPTMQAIALGGGSLINSAICARTPEFSFERWAEKSDTRSITRSALDPHYDRVEKFLFVEPTPAEVLGERNLRFKRGCDELGLSSEPTRRNVKNCRGSGECFTGCRNQAKQSTDVSYVPAAIRAGARVFTSVRAERILADGRVVRSVRGRVVEPFTWRATHEVEISAKVIVLAAGCMQTPLILLNSQLANSSGYVGKELQLHPGLALMAVYPEPIDPWKGATQGYHSLHYLREGIKLEVLWSPPAVLACRFPGFGYDYQRHLQTYNRMAPFDVIIAAEHSRGTVYAKWASKEPGIRFEYSQKDVDLIQRGLQILSDICWASGAESILPGIYGLPEVLRSKAEAEVLRTRKLRPADMVTASNHAFGTTRMSRDPKRGVVDEWGRCHDLDNLYIADTGIFPGSPAVNPMLTCMALADRIAMGLISH